MALEIFRAISNLRLVLDSETDKDSPVAEVTTRALREMIEILFQLMLDTGVSGTATSDPSNDANGYFYDSAGGWSDNDHDEHTLVICSGNAKGNPYTIDNTVASGGRLDCTGDNLYSDGVRSGDDYKIFYDIKTHTSGHNHDGVNSPSATVADGQITEAKLGASAVTTSKLKTTANTTGVSGSLNGTTLLSITMQDYCFFPNFYIGDEEMWLTGINASNVDTVGRVGVYNSDESAHNYAVRWRYVTATDKPFAHIIRDPATGEVLHVWISNDPPPDYWGLDKLPDDYIPPIVLTPDPGLENIVIHKYPIEDYFEILNKSKKDNRLLHEIINNDYEYNKSKRILTPKNLRTL